MTSTFVPGDMEFFNIQIQATRPDGKDLVPFWVTTKENLVCLFTFMLILIFHSFNIIVACLLASQ